MEQDDFMSSVADLEVTLAVVGLGYVGLPLAISYAESGFRTIGLDTDPRRIEELSRGESYIDDVDSGRVVSMTQADRFVATTDIEQLSDADVVFICVPTPFDQAKTPDLSYVESATRSVAGILRPGMLVILQSTTYPGTTIEIVQPILEERGLKAGVDFHLAFSPERVDPGNKVWTVHNTPKVVGGVTPEGGLRAQAILEAVMEGDGEVRVVSSPGTAEMSKLLENTYRAVNIALVNELAMLSHEMGIDIWEVIDAASTKPFGFQGFYPGIGPGGHCIPVDPYYLSWRAREFDFQTRFIELAADVNLTMARYVVGRVMRFLNEIGKTLNGSRVLCLGAAFKPGVSDVRNSRAVHVMELLNEAGAAIRFADPHVPTITIGGSALDSLDSDQLVSVLRSSDIDLVVVLVRHTDWPVAAIRKTEAPIFDAVNLLGRPSSSRHHRI